MNTEEILSLGKAHIMNTYGRFPMSIVKGSGTIVWDADGKSYLDFVTGLAVTSLGHANPDIVSVITEQAGAILHSSNLYWVEPQAKLAQMLCTHSFADKAFFGNSGAEANEGAIKLARKYAKKNYGNEKYNIVTLKNSFHGRTLATLTATGQEKYQKGYEPLPAGFSYVEINNLNEMEAAVNERTAAVIIEPIQGEGGVYPVPQEFLQKVRDLCDHHHALLIFDEVQCGMGRTGKLFAHEWHGIKPDIMTLAKALGNGVPIGAMLATDRVASAFQPGDHASTFGGNHLATAVGCKVMEIMTADGFLEGVQQKSRHFTDKLNQLARKFHLDGEVRGLGLMLGLPAAQGTEIVNYCCEHGLLLNCIGAATLRFLPPLTVSTAEMDQAVEILEQAIAHIVNIS